MRLISLVFFAGLMACGQSHDLSLLSAPPTPSYNASIAAQVTGKYAVRMKLASVQKAPFIGDVTSNSSLYVVANIAWDGVHYTVEESACKFTHDAGTAPIKVTVSEKVTRSGGTLTSPLAVWEQDGVIHFQKESSTVVLGAKLANIEKDALPTKDNDPRLVDADEDGNPGATAHASGTIKVGFIKKKIDADIYIVQRSRTSYLGTLKAAGNLKGLVETGTEQNIIGSDSALLKVVGSVPSTQDQDKSKSTIEFVKIQDGAGCDDVSWAGVFAG